MFGDILVDLVMLKVQRSSDRSKPSSAFFSLDDFGGEGALAVTSKVGNSMTSPSRLRRTGLPWKPPANPADDSALGLYTLMLNLRSHCASLLAVFGSGTACLKPP